MKNALKKLTHEHKVELTLLGGSSLFDISFGLEKLFEAKHIFITPYFWAIFWILLGLLLSIITILDFIYDMSKDNK